MLQFLTSWSVLLGLAMVLRALALLIEPAIPSRPNGQLTEVAELTNLLPSSRPSFLRGGR
jgi:hypothetical protein